MSKNRGFIYHQIILSIGMKRMKDRCFIDTNIWVYTEDLQHNQTIDQKIKIINPFKKI